jgi:hypothetical protein
MDNQEIVIVDGQPRHYLHCKSPISKEGQEIPPSSSMLHINDSPFYHTNPMIEVRFDYRAQKASPGEQSQPKSRANASITSKAKVMAKALVNDVSAAQAILSPMSRRSYESQQLQGISGQQKQLAPR